MSTFNFTKDEETSFFEFTEFRERVSDHLVAQIRLTLEEGRINTDAISEEIRWLEGLSSSTRTKRPSKFKGGKLTGFWHSHFFNGDPHQQATNYLKILDREGVAERIIKEIMNEYPDPMVSARKIAKRFVQKQFEDMNRAKSFTGDWIIYAKHNNENYYLMICAHPEKGEDTDPIYENIKDNCRSQFPFLF